METITSYRAAVQQAFADGLDIKFVGGRLEGPNQFGEWLGSVYLQRVQEDAARVAEQQIFLVVRVFAPFSSQGSLSPSEPYDPAPLEQMAEKILAVAAANQTGLGAWFQRVTSIEIDPVTQGIQAMVFAYSSNPGVAQ